MKKFAVMLLLLLSGCYDEYPVKLPDVEPQFIVDGWLSNLIDDSYIKFGWSATEADKGCSLCSPDNPKARISNTITAHLTDDNGLDLQFQTTMPWKKDIVEWAIPNFTGIVGNKYYLDIDVTSGGKTKSYHAETIMLPTPSIDAIDYEIRQGAVGKEDAFVPLISFTEPAGQRNYYMFSISAARQSTYSPPDSWRVFGTSYLASASIMPDTFLPEHVSRLTIDDGNDTRKYAQFYPMVDYPGDGAMVLMYSVDEITFKFYKALIDQYDYNGAAYSSNPASPPGNISNGALGIFRATQVSGAAVFLE